MQTRSPLCHRYSQEVIASEIKHSPKADGSAPVSYREAFEKSDDLAIILHAPPQIAWRSAGVFARTIELRLSVPRSNILTLSVGNGATSNEIHSAIRAHLDAHDLVEGPRRRTAYVYAAGTLEGKRGDSLSMKVGTATDIKRLPLSGLVDELRGLPGVAQVVLFAEQLGNEMGSSSARTGIMPAFTTFKGRGDRAPVFSATNSIRMSTATQDPTASGSLLQLTHAIVSILETPVDDSSGERFFDGNEIASQLGQRAFSQSPIFEVAWDDEVLLGPIGRAPALLKPWTEHLSSAEAAANERAGVESDGRALEAYELAMLLAPDDLAPDSFAHLVTRHAGILIRLNRPVDARGALTSTRSRWVKTRWRDDGRYTLACAHAMERDRRAMLRALRSIEVTRTYFPMVRANLESYFVSYAQDLELLELLGRTAPKEELLPPSSRIWVNVREQKVEGFFESGEITQDAIRRLKAITAQFRKGREPGVKFRIWVAGVVPADNVQEIHSLLIRAFTDFGLSIAER